MKDLATLPKQIEEALENSVENGYHTKGMDAPTLAADLQRYWCLGHLYVDAEITAAILEVRNTREDL